MIGLVMAGGRGTRMHTGEKLLLPFKKPIIFHVLDALNNSNCFENIIALVSKNAPKTFQALENNIQTIESAGMGYVQDLAEFLIHSTDDVFVCSGDLPLLDKTIIAKMVSYYDPTQTWTSFVVTKKFLDSLGIKSSYTVDQCAYTGISLVNAKNITNDAPIPEHHIILDDKRIAFNLNTKQDYDLLCRT